ncbi:phosphatidylinositol-4- kinase [Blastocladiella emersonii ATCC 22665]|nr:phosphatidylinositol-4- kinase [Blastocladiella emersonii ATCC 22665]
MRPRLHARLWNEIALLSSQIAAEDDVGDVTATTTSAENGDADSVSPKALAAALLANGSAISFKDGAAVSSDPDGRPVTPPTTGGTGASPKRASASLLGDWDNVAALIATAAHTPAQQPDRLAHDVAVTCLRNAASHGHSATRRGAAADFAWAPLERVLDGVWTTLVALVRDVANASDFFRLTSSQLPALIGLLRAMDDAVVPIPSPATFDSSVAFLHEISGPRAVPLLNAVSEALARLEADPNHARLRKRLAGYWTRTPFSADAIHSQALALLRNALALQLCADHVAPGGRPKSKFLANSVPPSANTSTHVLNETAAAPTANGTGSAAAAAVKKSESVDIATLRSFKAAWEIICTAPGLHRLAESTVPAAAMEKLTTLCLQHFNYQRELRASGAASSAGPGSNANTASPEALAMDLQTCTLAWIQSPLPLDAMVPILFSVFRPPESVSSPVLGSIDLPGTGGSGNKGAASPPAGSATSDIVVLIAAADCLSVLSAALSANPTENAPALAQIQSFLQDLLTGPHPAFQQSASVDALTSFRASVTRALAHTARALPKDRTAAVLYTLVRNASGDVAQAKLDNCIAGLTAIAEAVRRVDVFDTVIPFLIRLLAMGDEHHAQEAHRNGNSNGNGGSRHGSVSSAGRITAESTPLDTRGCLRHLARLALVAPLDTFAEVARYLSQYARDNISDDRVTRAVMASVDAMAEEASPEQRRIVLHTLLTYFTNKAVWLITSAPTSAKAWSSMGTTDRERARAEFGRLLSLVAKMCRATHAELGLALNADGSVPTPAAAANAAAPSADGITDASITALFRTAWYCIVVLDLVSNEATQDSVVEIACTTPPVTYAPVIESYFLSPAYVTRVSQLIATPSLASALTPEQALYLLTLYHIMCCCASESRLNVLGLLQRMVDDPKPILLPVFLQLLDTVMVQFFFKKKPASSANGTASSGTKPVRDVPALIALTLQLLRGATHAHAQIASTCQSFLARLVDAYEPLMFAREVALAALAARDGTAARDLVRTQFTAAGTAGSRQALVVALLADSVVGCPTRSLAAVLGRLPATWVDAFTWNVAHWAAATAKAKSATLDDVLKRCHEAIAAEHAASDVKKTAAETTAHGEPVSSVGVPEDDHITELLFEAAAFLCRPGGGDPDMLLLSAMVHLATAAFTRSAVRAAVAAWHTVLLHFSDLEASLLLVLERAWLLDVVGRRRGLFAARAPVHNPLADKIHYTGDKFDVAETPVELEFDACLMVIDFLTDRLTTNLATVPAPLLRLLLASTRAHDQLTKHPESRAVRFALLTLALRAASHPACPDEIRDLLRSQVMAAALMWFALPPAWARRPEPSASRLRAFLAAARATYAQQVRGGARGTAAAPATNHDIKLLELLLANELENVLTWGAPENPMPAPEDVAAVLAGAAGYTAAVWRVFARAAWRTDPAIAFHLSARFHLPAPLELELEQLTMSRAHSPRLHACVDAVRYLLTPANLSQDHAALRYLGYWTPMPPVKAITLFQEVYQYHPLVLQYAMRSLFAYPIEAVFFFVPQIVQALRHDPLGYVQEFILRAARTSSVFAHQIIWNMKANMYRDEAGNVPDSLQPLFDELIDLIIKSFTPEDQSFYQREFDFFNKITSISGKLKPYIKKSKPEKKKKIDEEMALIKVDVGCYLPSNPESTVIDIDYNSGRPLQSHAKAPFLATFKIERQSPVPPHRIERVWQSAIFKVGDDCRQDVLALQLIAMFKSVFAAAHLDLYLFPYRVVATAPGCGVIEVIPNSISRDMMGREKINSLFDYFVAKFGGPHTPAFRKAQRNFITSVAGYSVILFLLQIKDRHNGNIMLDEQGHMVHIDFGFILDISPGGINFESAPFKLTTEMLQIIGPVGSDTFRDFARCVVQAFLAVRPYADAIIALVQLMAESGLPCFRGEPTLRKLRARFVLEKSERDAARFMMDRIAESYENRRTVLYDQFQKQTNGIPY